MYDVTEAETREINALFTFPGQKCDEAKLRLALATPQETFLGVDLHETICEKAAILLVHLLKHKPFQSANRQTAWVVSFSFLQRNGIRLVHLPPQEICDLVVAVEQGSWDARQVAEFFESNIELS